MQIGRLHALRSSANPWERHGEGAHSLSIFNRFRRHVRRNRAFSLSEATENASPFRFPPGKPAGFQEIGPSHQKRYFFDGLNGCESSRFCYSPSSTNACVPRIPGFSMSISIAQAFSRGVMRKGSPVSEEKWVFPMRILPTGVFSGRVEDI